MHDGQFMTVLGSLVAKPNEPKTILQYFKCWDLLIHQTWGFYNTQKFKYSFFWDF